LYQVH